MNWRAIAAELIVAVSLLSAPIAAAADFFVVTATFASQADAQQEASLRGGWVLDTDVYPKLTPGKFAVVRGPYVREEDARKEMKFLAKGGRYPQAYVRDAGRSRLPVDVGSPALTSKLLGLLLGELAIEVADHPGGENPCEPQEPYQAISLSHASLHRTLDEAGKERAIPVRRQVDFGGLWVIKRTGEIEHMRVCWE